MHQKHSSGARGFDVCSGDTTATSTGVTAHRAVLQTPVCVADAVDREDVFETPAILLPAVTFAPGTPPPRLG